MSGTPRQRSIQGATFRTFGSYCVLGVRRGSCVAEIVVKVNRKTLLLASSFLALFALACSYGVGVGRYRLSPYAQVRALGNSFRTIAGETETKLYGRWGRARASRGLASDDEETLNRLSALGYLRGYTPAENAGGVTVLEAGSVEDGLTLFTSGLNRTGFLGDLIAWEDGVYGTSKSVFSGSARTCRPDGRGAPGGPRLRVGGAAVGGAEARLHGGDAADVGAAGAA